MRQFCYRSEGTPKPNKVLWEAPVQANIANMLASPDSFSDKNYVGGEINYKYVKEFKHLKSITYPNTNHNADDENSKELCKIAYFIMPPVDNVFNLFTGFAQKYDTEFVVDAAAYQLITDHIYNIWCKKDEAVYNYVMNWLAHLVQKPNVKISTAILLKSQFQGR
jgi:hypothetical protein